MIERRVYELKRQYGNGYDAIVRYQYAGVITVDGMEIYNHLFDDRRKAWDRINRVQVL